jgi:transcriptional regulator with XRE-family HTH domain
MPGKKLASLGRRILELRIGRKESLQDVASAVEVSKAHVWELEKGRASNPSMALVTRLADHFGVSIGRLVGEDFDAPDADGDLARMFRQAQSLGAQDRLILGDMIRSLRRRAGQADPLEPSPHPMGTWVIGESGRQNLLEHSE